MRRPLIDISALPDIKKAEMDFLDSSFFQSLNSEPRELPSPASVIQDYGDGGARVVTIEGLKMAVKIDFTDHLRLEEVQAMRAIRQILPTEEIPVPEVFGWRRHGDQLFIYMSLVQGITLHQAWPSLTADDKVSIQRKLRQVVSSLRQIVQDDPQQISSVNGGPVQDRIFRPDHEKGPLPSIRAFNDWLFAAATRQNPGEDGIINGLDHPCMYRDLLPDSGKVYFTHGDLTQRNIMVSGPPGSCKVVGIIDWEQAGWYPEYWEFCKMHFGAAAHDEWSTDEWPEKILEAHEDAFFAFSEYNLWRGG